MHVMRRTCITNRIKYQIEVQTGFFNEMEEMVAPFLPFFEIYPYLCLQKECLTF